MDEKDCSRDRNGDCPGALYKSPLSVRCKCHYDRTFDTKCSISGSDLVCSGSANKDVD